MIQSGALSNLKTPLPLQERGIPSKLVSRKVKLSLKQPDILCTARKRVQWWGKGRIIIEHPTYYIVEFKYQGTVVSTLYDRDLKRFIDDKFRDLVLDQS